VLRREYNDNIAGLREDVRYMRNRLDVLVDRIKENK
jgi:hypothetical protein